ncbi:MAG TPA: hypothetical protein VJQ83_01485 [Tepidiformaceae bacterium]|nr:hypothetical protein [Tepidiformaceae bacterium]
MDMFKKKSLCAALAGIGALGVAGAAQAVNVNGNGLGEVLIYPYYTARNDGAGNAYNSLLTVVNTTASVKSVKVRFLEGKNSREVLDFNLFLSPHDVWTAAVSATGSGGAGVSSSDASCILPNQLPSGGQAFVNFAYTGGNADGADTSLDRTMEGYVEIIEMATYASTSTTAANVTHVAGVPPGCAKETDALAASEALAPSGGLMGTMALINVDSGNGYSYDAVALANYSTNNLYAASGLPQPDLTEAFPPISLVFSSNATYQSTWGLGTADPVSATLMHDNVLNEYVLDTSTASGTDWVVTMPTKRFYVFPAAKSSSADQPFQRNFLSTGACDDVSLNIYDREERTTSTPLSFSPPPPTSTNSICWEANVITFNNSNVLGSTNVANIPTSFPNGWLDMGWTPNSGATGAHQMVNVANTTITPLGGTATTGNTVTYVGVPVVGFAAESFVNNGITVGGSAVLSAYGNTYPHRYTTLINTAAP